MQVQQRNLNGLVDKLRSSQEVFRKALENKDIQEEKYKDWIQNVKEIEQKAISVGIDAELL